MARRSAMGVAASMVMAAPTVSVIGRASTGAATLETMGHPLW